MGEKPQWGKQDVHEGTESKVKTCKENTPGNHVYRSSQSGPIDDCDPGASSQHGERCATSGRGNLDRRWPCCRKSAMRASCLSLCKETFQLGDVPVVNDGPHTQRSFHPKKGYREVEALLIRGRHESDVRVFGGAVRRQSLLAPVCSGLPIRIADRLGIGQR